MLLNLEQKTKESTDIRDLKKFALIQAQAQTQAKAQAQAQKHADAEISKILLGKVVDNGEEARYNPRKEIGSGSGESRHTLWAMTQQNKLEAQRLKFDALLYELYEHNYGSQ